MQRTVVTEKYDAQGNVIERVTTTEELGAADLVAAYVERQRTYIDPIPYVYPQIGCWPPVIMGGVQPVTPTTTGVPRVDA